MTSYSTARTMKTFKVKVFLISLGILIGLSYEAFARKQMVLEQGTAEIIKFDGNVKEIFVADPTVADIQLNGAKAAYIYGKKTGATTIFASNKEGENILDMDVQVTHNLTSLKTAIRNAYPHESVKVTSIQNGIALEGDVSSPQVSKDIFNIAQRYLPGKETALNNMQITMPTQVYISVKVAEVKRTVLNQLDINWKATASIGSFTFGLLTGRDPLSNGVFSRAAEGTNLNSMGFRGTHGSKVDITALIDALNQEGLSTLLAEPNLVAVSGETAKVLVGGEYPYTVPQDLGQVTIEFKPFGIGLDFTPTVLNQKLINLKVRPSVTALDFDTPVVINNLKLPIIRGRSAETSIEMASGDSMVIAGLYSKEMTNTIKEFPGLGDIPVLGALFRSTQFQRDETELVIIVTPYLVRPVTGHNLQKPTDNLRFASQLEMILLNRLNSYDHNNNPSDQPESTTNDVAATLSEVSAEGVIYDQPLAAIVEEGEGPVGQRVEANRQAMLRPDGPQAETALIGDAGFYTE